MHVCTTHVCGQRACTNTTWLLSIVENQRSWSRWFLYYRDIRYYGLALTLSILQQTHIRNYYNHTHLDQAYNMWGVAQHHRCNWMQLLCNFLDLLEQSNSHLNLAYQLLQAQHLLKSAHERYLSLILPTSLSLSLEPARNPSLYITQTST